MFDLPNIIMYTTMTTTVLVSIVIKLYSIAQYRKVFQIKLHIMAIVVHCIISVGI
jgi:hypothetical protein